jgi:hypothetical protein
MPKSWAVLMVSPATVREAPPRTVRLPQSDRAPPAAERVAVTEPATDSEGGVGGAVRAAPFSAREIDPVEPIKESALR